MPKRRPEHPGVPSFKGKRIVFASQINVNRLGPYVDQVLEALGHPEALVTDESCISDFIGIDRKDPFDLDAVSEALGIPIDRKDYIWKIAQKLADKAVKNE